MAKDKIRVKLEDGVTEVKAIISHPMESGRRRDKATGNLIPEHFIKEVLCVHNGNTVLTANWGGGVSANPYMSFRFKGGNKGDTVTLKWTDTKGETGELEGKIS